MTFAAIFLQVAGGRLLDVENALEPGRGGLAHAPQALEQIPDVRAALIEIEQVLPVGDLPRRQQAIDDAVDAEDAIDIGLEIAAIQLDLEASQPVPRYPLLERIRQTVVDPITNVRGFKRIAGADGMEHRRARTRRGRDVPIEILPFERGAEIVRQVAGHERRTVGLVAAHPERLTVGIVDRGVERTGDDERAEFRNRNRQFALFRQHRSGA